MYIAKVPNRNSPPAILLREGYREDGKVKNRTLANLTRWPEDKVEALRQILKAPPGQAVALLRSDQPPTLGLDVAFEITRTRPHGLVAAVLGTLRRLGLEKVIDPSRSRMRNLAVALVVARVTGPCSKLATARGLDPATLTSTLGEVLEVSGADQDDLYQAMDWLVTRQARIEDQLAKKHLNEGMLVLYDVSSAAFEGTHCPLAKLGYPRDGVKGRQQIVYGLLTNKHGCPVAVEVFEGNTADPTTVAAQVAKVKQRFGLIHVVMVGDRGMITKTQVSDQLKDSGLDWITALKAPTIKALVAKDVIQPSLFDQINLAEVTSDDYPGERLVVCKNPMLAAEHTRKRLELLAATERDLAKIQQAAARDRRPLRGKAQIGLRTGKVIGRYKMAKHFELQIDDDSFTYRRLEQAIADEAALDGIYVIRTSVAPELLSSAEVVASYKRLAQVERAFRIFNNDLQIRPIRHWKPERVKAHLLICMLAHYVEWHMLEQLAPMLFQDHDRQTAESLRADPVQPAKRSPQALAKASTKTDSDGEPVHSFQSLIDDLATLAANHIRPADPSIPEFDILTTPTPVQQRAFQLLHVSHRLGFS
jgi:hypothetical protein